MRDTLTAVFLLFCLGGFGTLIADEAPLDSNARTTSPQVTPETDVTHEAKKHDGLTVFWIVFSVAVVFVLSSATALKRLGSKPPPHAPHRPGKQPGRLPEGEKRFRL